MPKAEKIKRVEEPLIIRDAHIIYRNFAGAKGRYSAAGIRTFDVVIDDEHLATLLINDGWNLKPFKPRLDEEAMPGYHLPVVVAFEKYPPKVIMVTNIKANILGQEKVSLLDSADLIKCDLEIRPSNWVRDDGSHGVKAYLKTLYAVVKPDPFADDYSYLVFSEDGLDGGDLPTAEE